MPRNGSGNYVLPTGQPVVPATTVSSSVFNTLVADVGAELTRSVSTDGQTPMAADLPMGGNKISNLALGTQPTDAARMDQVGGAGTITLPSGAITSVGTKILEDVKTADYPSFAAAASVAAGRRLIVNSTILVTTNTTIPANIEVFVPLGGFFNISGGVVLTIAGTFNAGEYTIFGGAGSPFFTVTSRARDLPVWRGAGQTAIFSQSRTLLQSPTDVGGPVHAVEDNNTLNFTNPKAANFNAYAAFDANTTIGGPGAYEHYVSFQARPTYNGTGEIWIRLDTFVSRPVHNGTGVIAQMTGMRVQRPDGTGPITNYYGILIEAPAARASGENYAVYASGGDILTFGDLVAQGAPGNPAALRVRSNGIGGGFGVSLVCQASGTAILNQANNSPLEIWTNNTKRLRVLATGVPTYVDRAAASAGGLTTGDIYQTAIGQLMIV